MELEKIKPVLKQVFPNQQYIEIGMTKGDIEDWDSVAHLTLIIELEEEFGINIAQNEIVKLDSISDIIELVSKKLNRAN